MSDPAPAAEVIEIILQTPDGHVIERASHPPSARISDLIERARAAREKQDAAPLVLRYQGHMLEPRMTLGQLLKMYPIAIGGGEGIALRFEVSVKRRADSDTGGRYYSLRKALQELEVEYEELAALVADGKIRAFRLNDTTRFSRVDVLSLKTPRETKPRELREDELSLTETLSVLRTDTRSLMQLVSEGELRAFREGDEIHFLKNDVDQARDRGERRYHSLPEVLAKLRIDEQALARLVADGQIRAFRDGDEMWFRRSDVDEMASDSDEERRLFSIAEVQQMLGAHEEDLARMVADGELRAFRDGDQIRFPRADIAELVNAPARAGLVSPVGPPPSPQRPPSRERVAALDDSGRRPTEPTPEAPGTGRAKRERSFDEPASGRPSDGVTVRAAPRSEPVAVDDEADASELTRELASSEARLVVDCYLSLASHQVHPLTIRVEPVQGEGAPIEIAPHVPGCLISPSSAHLDLGVAGEARFAITPLIGGQQIAGRLEIRHAGRVLRAFEMPLEVVGLLGPIRLLIAIGLGTMIGGVALELAGVAHLATSPLASSLALGARALGGFEAAGLVLGASLLALAFLLLQRRRPRLGAPLATVVEVLADQPSPPAPFEPRRPSQLFPAARPMAPQEREPVPERYEQASWPDCQLLGVNAVGFREFKHAPTGIALVEIPAGPFWMGADGQDPHAQSHERPRRRVDLSTYLIGMVPVTVSQFRRFVAERPRWAPGDGGESLQQLLEGGLISESYLRGWRRGDAQRTHPVTGVSWHAAAAFCAWAGLSLPTEAQWEKAARGSRGARFPWGDHPPDHDLCRFDDIRLAPVWDAGRYAGYYAAGASPFGVLEMAGNALEWVADLYDPLVYVEGPLVDPSGPPEGQQRVVRGGSYHSQLADLRAAARAARPPETCEASLGFRVAITRPSTR